jgi:hypothetical protein
VKRWELAGLVFEAVLITAALVLFFRLLVGEEGKERGWTWEEKGAVVVAFLLIAVGTWIEAIA